MPHPMLPEITIGADPELFVRNLSTGQIVSAHDLLPGTKAEPFPVKDGAIQVDGVAAEFNITPASHSEYFTAYCGNVMSQLQTRLGSGYELVMEPVAFFDTAYFERLPKLTRELGCNPDFNAWTGQVNEPPESVMDGKAVMRTAAGHIHLGGWVNDQDVKDPDVFADCCVIARQMDYFLGIWSLKWDTEARRRLMYGKAGSFRVKPYGLEYRPLSNRWLATPQLQSWVWTAAWQGIRALFNGLSMESKYGDLARTIIDENRTDWYETGDGRKMMLDMNMRQPPAIPAGTVRVKQARPTPTFTYSPPLPSWDNA